MIFLLLRRLGPRARFITGLALVVAGLGVVGAARFVAGLLIHGIILTVVGVVLFASGAAAGRRARGAAGTAPAGDGDV